jgi:hypothetical protein
MRKLVQGFSIVVMTMFVGQAAVAQDALAQPCTGTVPQQLQCLNDKVEQQRVTILHHEVARIEMKKQIMDLEENLAKLVQSVSPVVKYGDTVRLADSDNCLHHVPAIPTGFSIGLLRCDGRVNERWLIAKP